MVVKSNENPPCNSFWQGGKIYINLNGQRKATIPAGFRNFQYCLSSDEIDIEHDRVQLKSSNNDNVCIESLIINGKQIFVGALNNQPSFIIDGNQNYCKLNKMVTAHITIQNGQVISSKCKGIFEFLLLKSLGILEQEQGPSKWPISPSPPFSVNGDLNSNTDE